MFSPWAPKKLVTGPGWKFHWSTVPRMASSFLATSIIASSSPATSATHTQQLVDAISLAACSPESTYSMASCWGSGNNCLQEMGLLGLSATSFSGRRPRQTPRRQQQLSPASPKWHPWRTPRWARASGSRQRPLSASLDGVSVPTADSWMDRSARWLSRGRWDQQWVLNSNF
jgi:hypothetical protein